MDMNQLNHLSDDQKRDYMELSRVFAEKAWERITEIYKQKAEAAEKAGANAGTWEENRYLLGLRHAYEEFASLEENTESLFVQLSESAQEVQETVDEEIFE